MSAPGRQGYRAVMGVVVFLAVINALAYVARKAIPPPEPSPDMMGKGDFLERAAHQAIRWKPATADAVAAARRAGKPILIVAGSRVSPLARAFDDRVFDDIEVAERINREFTPLRVDVFAQPEWRAFFLPFTKIQLGSDLNFDVVVLDTSGRLVTSALLSPKSARADEVSFQDFLSNALKAARSDDRELQLDQQQQLTLLTQHSDRNMPDPTRGEGIDDGVDLLPWNIRLRLAMGQRASAISRTAQVLAGPGYDWQGWGFFSQALNPEWTQVAPVKEAMRTQDMGVALARLGLSTGRSDLILISKHCLNRIGFYRTGFTELIDVTADGRIEGKSVPTSYLREGLDADLRGGATALWSLDPNGNPQMLPFPRSTTDLETNSAEYARVLAGILRRQPRKPDAVPAEEAWFFGAGTARMLEGGFLLNDPDILERGEREWERLQEFRSGPDDVIRSGTQSFPASLADYLGFAEAAYWAWTTLGDQEAFEEGEAVMNRAWFLFADDASGSLKASATSGPKLGEIHPNLPLWFDAERASDPGRFAHLWMSYGRVSESERYIDRARKVLLYYGSFANSLPNRSGSLMLASHFLNGSAVFKIVGPDTPRLWRAWSVARPGALIVRAINEDLEPGVYRFAGGETVKMPDNPALAGLPPAAGTPPDDASAGP